ncbi:MAG: DNA primase [Deltaproteobacteria bacterium]|nr:DNA primase [Deltaproteobacteria bacterium]
MKNQQIVDSVRQSLDIVQIIGEVVPLKKSGNNFFGCCPFHNEKTPSFSVSSTKQLFHCFGCKVGGDVFKFVQLYFKWDFPQALEELAKRAGIQIEKIKTDPTWEEGFRILEIAMMTFEDALDSKEGEDFRSYLKARKIPEKLWKDFRLGAHTGGFQLLSDKLHEKNLSREIAVKLGLLGRSERGEYFDRFQGRVIFPILDEKGRPRGFGARSLGNDHPKYLNSPKSAHFDKGRLFYGMHLACSGSGKGTISRKGYSVLVEGYLDVIALHEYGISNALGSMGTALTSDQIRLLKRWSPRVISLYDADRAGLQATEKNLGNFLKEGLESKVVVLPNSKDPDALLHDETKSPEDRKLLLKKAFDESILAVDYLVQNTVLVEKNAMNRGKKLRSLVDILDQVPDEIERAVLKKDLAARFELPENLLFPKAAPEAQRPPPMGARKAVDLDKDLGRWEREILRFLVLSGEKAEFSLTELVPYLFSTSKWGSLLLRLIELQLKSQTIAELHWLNEVESENQSTIREWALEMKPELNSNEAVALWADLVRGVKRSYFQRESERIQKNLIAAEEARDSDLVRRLLTEKQDLMKFFKGQEKLSLTKQPVGVYENEKS